MRLAVYHPWVYLPAGAERVLANLVTRSRHDWTLYTHHFSPRTTFPEFADCQVVELQPRVEVRRSLGALAPAAVTMGRARIPGGHDGLLISSEGLGDLVAFGAQVPTASYCHTPLKILHDPVARRNLAERNRRQALALCLLGPTFSAVDRRAWRRFRHVFVNSTETAQRVERARLRPGGPLEVLHPGVDLDRYPPGDTDRKPVFLVAGRIMWQKRIELALDAFALSGAGHRGARLVVAGAVDDKSRPYLAELRRRSAGRPVSFELDCSDAQMAELYAQASVVVFTAPNEDFGMVPLEAMAAGTPVLATRGGGALETVVDGATGWLLPPRPEAFAAKLTEVLDADLSVMRVAARRRAAEFGWDRFVARVDDVMEQLASG